MQLAIVLLGAACTMSHVSAMDVQPIIQEKQEIPLSQKYPNGTCGIICNHQLWSPDHVYAYAQEYRAAYPTSSMPGKTADTVWCYKNAITKPKKEMSPQAASWAMICEIHTPFISKVFESLHNGTIKNMQDFELQKTNNRIQAILDLCIYPLSKAHNQPLDGILKEMYIYNSTSSKSLTHKIQKSTNDV
ncbi:MAG TPA: hypothetical protein VGW78_04270 [Candidatus Babeliales bacterium]|jgi:hypothetical protein|nr:hypothetical protein [Candidatus Babeliales bacterium]